MLYHQLEYVTMFAVQGPVYTDDRECEFCNRKEKISEGENYCSQCHVYLCLQCTLNHGKECAWTRNITGIENRYSEFLHRQTDKRYKQTLPRHEKDTDFEASSAVIKRCQVDAAECNYPWLRQHIKTEREMLVASNRNSRNNSSLDSSSRRSMSSRCGTIVVGETGTSSRDYTLLTCRRHPEMNVENYCRKHDALCCEDCLVIDHVTCMVQPLDEVAVGIRNNIHMAKIIEITKALILSCDVAVLEKTTELKEVKRQIKDYRALADKTNKQNIDENNNCLTHIEELQNEHQAIDRNLGQLKFIRTNLEVSLSEIKNAIADGNDMVTFVALKLNQQLIVKSKIDLSTILKCATLSLTNIPKPKTDEVLKVNKHSTAYCQLENPLDNLQSFGLDKYPISPETTIKTQEAKDVHANMPVDKICTGKRIGPLDIINMDSKRFEELGQRKKEMRRSSSGRTFPQSAQKSSAKSRRTTVSPAVARRDRITTYGLATEYYLNQMIDVPNDKEKEIVRLQSPEPEKKVVLSTLTAINDDSDEDDKGIDRPLETASLVCESVDNKESNNSANSFVRPFVFEHKKPVENVDRGSEKKSLHKVDKSLQIPQDTSTLVEKKLASKIDTMERNPKNTHNHFVERSTKQRNNNTCLLASELTFTKESTFIKIADPNRNISSAKSRSTDEEIHLHNRYLYVRKPRTRLELKDEQIVRLPTDKTICAITGIACLPDGRIAVADSNNKSVKVLIPGISKAMVLILDEPPSDVTAVSNVILMAVYGLACDQLIVISVNHELTLTKRFRTGCFCKSLTTYNSHVYMLCISNYKTEVRVLNADGYVRIRLSLGHILSAPISIAVNPLDGVVFVTDKTRGVYSVETGREVKRFSDGHVECYHEITTDNNNNVFVCTEQPGGIYEVVFEGNHLVSVPWERSRIYA